MAKGDNKPGGSQQERTDAEQTAPTGGGVLTDETQPGDADRANALAADPSVEQVTQTGDPAPAEGQRIRDAEREAADERGVVTLAEAMTVSDKKAVQYDDAGRLVNADGKQIALAADATDPDVGWTVQQAGGHLDEGDRTPYPGGSSGIPDQTVHPDELPDPIAALQSGQLPQNAGVLNIDPKKFEGKKSLEA